MRRGRLMAALVSGALTLGVVAYMMVYIFQAVYGTYSTSEAVLASIESTVPITGWFARDEVVVLAPSDTRVSETAVREGEKVARGTALVVTYESEQAVTTGRDIASLEYRLQQLEAASGVTSAGEIAKLDSRLDEEIYAFAYKISNGSYRSASDSGNEIKTLILKRDYFSGRVGEDEHETLIDSLRSELNTLKARQSGAVKSISAPQSGYFTSAVDGYENILTMENVLDMSPLDLDRLADRRGSVSAAAVGKIATGFAWRFAAVLDTADAAVLKLNSWVLMRFSGDYSGEIRVRVYQIGEDKGSKTTVVFSCSTRISETLPLRRGNAELVLESYEGVRVPKQALRVGENGKNGVYVLEAQQAKFIEVDIIREAGTFYLVKYTPDSAKALRPGDEIIVNSKKLHDGKILQ